MPLYDFATHSRRPETRAVAPGPVVLVEGILILADPRVLILDEATSHLDTESEAWLDLADAEWERRQGSERLDVWLQALRTCRQALRGRPRPGLSEAWPPAPSPGAAAQPPRRHR